MTLAVRILLRATAAIATLDLSVYGLIRRNSVTEKDDPRRVLTVVQISMWKNLLRVNILRQFK
jgi:hypothetical protein